MQQGNIWFTSDTHFGHKNVINYNNRPYETVEEMDQALIKNWNALVKPKDEVWHLGDFAFSKIGKIYNVLDQLNGKINLVTGNHDGMILKHKEELLSTQRFKSIQPYKELNYNKQKIVLCHYAMRVWNKSHYGTFMLYGHSHGSLPPFGRSVDVGVDSKYITSEFRPININEIFEYMNNIKIHKVDHH